MNTKPIYNPLIHHRRSIRLKGYDYSNSGSYFITICCHDKMHKFGLIDNDLMILNEMGKIAHNEWLNLLERFLNIELDVFQIMPNHMHGIITLNSIQDNPSSISVSSNDEQTIYSTNKNPYIDRIVGAYKSIVHNECLDNFKEKWINVNPQPHMGRVWHRNYFEHIIRDEKSYNTIAEYIINNPARWAMDKFKT